MTFSRRRGTRRRTGGAVCATTHRSTAPVVRNRPGWPRARELHGARSHGGPAETRTMVVDRPSRRSAVFAPCTPCRRACVRRHRSTPGLVPSFHSQVWGVRTAKVRYQTRRCWSETSPQMLQGQRHVTIIMQHSRATQGRRMAPIWACPGGSDTPDLRLDRWNQPRGRTVRMAAR